MLSCFQHQPGGALRHLGGVDQGLLPGQAAADAAVGQGLQEQAQEGGAAARYGAARVNQPLLQPVQKARSSHGLGEKGQLLLRDTGIGVVEHHSGPHGAGGVGHDADDRVVAAGHDGDPLHGEPRRHGHQDKGICASGQHRPQLLHEPCHHLGLYPQEDVLGFFRHHAVVPGGTAQLGGQSFRLGDGAVAEENLLRGQALDGGPGQGGAHVARADKSKGIACHTHFLFSIT